MARLEQIPRPGYQVNFQWECEFDNSGISTPELLAHTTVSKSPLCTRDALYCCQTKDMLLHYKAREGETIHYVDVMRLYPYICKYNKFPVGHPVVHVQEACKEKEDCLRKEGLIKCTIVPPDKLYHPVLPFRAYQKLMLCQCRACVLTSNTEQCCHKTHTERALTVTWFIEELRLSVRKGYRILEIHEVYEYVTRYDPETREGGLFADYIDTFLKLKAEASGYTACVRTPADEER